MAALDWSQCSAVESIPGKVSGAWVFHSTRMPVATVFENLEAGATIDDIMKWFDVTREQVTEVLSFRLCAVSSLSPLNSHPSFMRAPLRYARASSPIREKRASWGRRACGARKLLSADLYGCVAPTALYFYSIFPGCH